jgi:hypothetical protein
LERPELKRPPRLKGHAVRSILGLMTDHKRPKRAELDAMLGFGGDKPDKKHAGSRLMGDRLDPDANHPRDRPHAVTEPSQGRAATLAWRGRRAAALAARDLDSGF